MKIVSGVGLILMSTAVFLCFQSNAQSTFVVPTPSTPDTIALKFFTFPSALPEFGTRTDKSIRVIVYGAIKRPGVYYLPIEATLGQAIESAKGTQFCVWSASFLVRPIDAERGERIRFGRKPQKDDLKMPLKENDQIRFLNLDGGY